MMNFALFLPASLRLGARLDEAETSEKPYRFTPSILSWLGRAMRESKTLERLRSDGIVIARSTATKQSRERRRPAFPWIASLRSQ
jgi:hypothetical protein